LYVQKKKKKKKKGTGKCYTIMGVQSCMDLLEFGCIMTALLTAAGLIFMKMSINARIIAEDYAIKRAKSEQASLAAKAKYQQVGEEDIAPWVTELLGGLGISPEAIFSDEMPPELAQMMPAITAFLKSGGLQKLLGGLAQGGGAAPPADGNDNKGYI
jgi:hypothetical protein